MRRPIVLLIVGVVALAAFPRLEAQAPLGDAKPLAFEVASVKAWRPGMAVPQIGPIQYGRNTFAVGPAPLGALLGLAFGVTNGITGLPDWSRTEQYTIRAKAEDGVLLTRENVRPRLQRLLADRFKLAAHIETTSANGYALVPAKAGTKLTGTTNSQVPASLGRGRIRAASVPMEVLAQMLTSVLRQPVANETGLAGNFEFTLTFAPEDAADSALPSIFTALEDQLGLKLEGGRSVPVETLVIDHVERPTED